jgi:hypothetical protein
MADVFITFAPSDAEMALRIQKSLERAGISASRGPVNYSANWPARLLDELDACAAVLALWSRDAVRSDWVMTEAAIGAHFGQTVSIRTDSALDRSQIPALFRDAPGMDIIDVLDSELGRGGGAAAEALDRHLAPVLGRIRALKARGPVAAAPTASGAVPPAEEAQRRLSAGFAWVRQSGERNSRSMPALAATRREAAFRSAYAALAAMDYPTDIRAGLVEFVDPVSARRGLARIYAEALSRNDREFWGLVGRLATPLSPTLTLAGLMRSGESSAVISDLIDPRDQREMHDERFGRARGRTAGGVVLWPLMAVAVGLVALVAAPQIQRVAPAFSFDMPKWPEAKTRQVAETEIAPPPWANGEKTVRAAPLPAPPPSPPQPIPTALPAPPPMIATPATPLNPYDVEAQAATRLRLCRLMPDSAEIVVEVMEGERLFDVAGRVFMDTPEGIAQIAARNAACLTPRTVMLDGGRVISGNDLLFAGDRLVIPAQTATSAAAPQPTALR